jgi:hypothetical protein
MASMPQIVGIGAWSGAEAGEPLQLVIWTAKRSALTLDRTTELSAGLGRQPAQSHGRFADPALRLPRWT